LAAGRCFDQEVAMPGSRFRPSAGEVRWARLALTAAILLASDVGLAEVPAIADPTASATLALRLTGPSMSMPAPTSCVLQRPLILVLDVGGPPAFELRRPALAPTLELSIETLRLFAGHTPRRISPFIGWSSNSLGLRVKF
jgi:hypothetical protein